ncbi:MAG TPA: hypothetical protein VL463_05950 [Kofleriaceae bacterium]|nr:hypothetical protein [Kofleriaceae bacterium]
MPAGPARETARNLAAAYHLDGDDDLFNESWDLSVQARDAEQALGTDLDDEVETAFDHFESAVRTGAMAGVLGHARLARRPRQGKYVVFSDHHLSRTGNRQNFCVDSGNLQLLSDVLQQYYDAGFTVIENGDVEDLVIFEVPLDTVRARQDMSLSELNANRAIFRKDQLQRIVDDPRNAPYYAQLAQLAAAGRLIRVAGNHDYNLQSDDFLSILQTKIPHLDRPVDYVFIDGPNKVDFAILHGHQFDPTCTPRFAPQLGELFSECMGLFFQGADRVWLWSGDPCSDWALGTKDFNNNLVTAEAGEVWGGQAGAAIGQALGTLHSEDGWETLFGHNIAWEYFEHNDPEDAFQLEVQPGLRWFKYRSLDELNIRAELLRRFDVEKRPRMICGHSHEARLQAAGPVEDNARDSFWYYLNSGSVGRFENLLWGIEIVDGEATMISWCRPGGAGVGEPERRTYESVALPTVPVLGPLGNVLAASKEAEALDTDPSDEWLPSLLRMMMR